MLLTYIDACDQSVLIETFTTARADNSLKGTPDVEL